jgi:hypothetical protein
MLADVNDLTRVDRHLFDLAMSAVRADNFGAKLKLHGLSAVAVAGAA